MKRTVRILAMVAVAGLIACARKEGPAERVGRNLDQAARDTADAVEDAGDRVEDRVDEMTKRR